MAAAVKKKEVLKTTVNLPKETLEALKEIAAKRGGSMADVIRQAIATEKFLFDTDRAGGKVLIEEKDKTLKQIVLR
jgi:predicted transcriptional regulator